MEEHARNLAEENVQQELSLGRETLEVSRRGGGGWQAVCLDGHDDSKQV